MRKLIALATVLVLVVVLAVPVTAVNYAPDRPPWIYERQTHATPSGDDSGWAEPDKMPPSEREGWIPLLTVNGLPIGVRLVVLWAVNAVSNLENNVSTSLDSFSENREINTK